MKNKIILLIAAIVVAWAMPQSGGAQQTNVKVSGVVLDKEKSPIPGATIVVEGTTQGTSTNAKGEFTINAKSGSVIIVSCIGYQNKNFIAAAQQFTITLDNAILVIDDIVVIGYGEMKKSDLTGSVASMKASDIEKTGALTFSEALQGRVAGVKVTTQSGEAGGGIDISIRGTNSLNAGTAPLYVIDGMQIDVNEGEVATSSVGGQTTYNPLASINPNDIASIDILKDASATAIYGARGANGVIIITTKSGQSSSKTDISFNTSWGVNRIAKRLDMLDAQGYVDNKFARGDNLNIWGKDYGSGVVARNVVTEGYDTYNWQDELTRDGFSQNYDVSLNAVVRRTRISSSVGYFHQAGAIRSNDFGRYSARIKLDHEMSSKFSFGASMTLGRVDNNGAITSGGENSNSNYTGVIQAMYSERPVRLYTPAELTSQFPGGFVPLTSMISGETFRKTVSDRVLANSYIQFKPSSTLTFRVNGSTTATNSKLQEFFSSLSKWGRSVNGRAGIQSVNSLGYTLSGTGTYQKTFAKKHRLNVMMGSEINGYHFENTSVRSDNFEDQSTGVFDISKGMTLYKPTSYLYQTNRASAFGRVNYDYKNKYYATINMRADASSNFSKGHRTGYFPSMALAWRVNQESFMSGVDLVDNLKLRASAGVTGNDRITPYSYMSMLASTYYANDSKLLFGLYPGTSDNSSLKWETTYQYNAGVDLSILKSRISIVADVYLKDTRNMLYNANIASQSGFNRKWLNIGRMTNQGVEVSISTRNVIKNNFTWTTNLNFDANRTQIISLGGEQSFPVSVTYGPFDNIGIVKVGEPIGMIYGYQCDGNYQLTDFTWTSKSTGAQVDASIINSDNMSLYNYALRSDVVSYKGVTVRPGDRKYKDITGDKTIDPNDRAIIGNTNPKFNIGFGNDIKLGNVDINIFVDGSYGAKILNAFRKAVEPGANNLENNLTRKSWEERWTPENPSNTYAGVKNQLDQQVSTYFVEDGSFVRLKNVIVGYTFGKRFFGNSGIQSIRVYGMIDNVYTFTNYTGLDPEVRSPEKFLRGLDQMAYPRTRNFLFGINVNF